MNFQLYTFMRRFLLSTLLTFPFLIFSQSNSFVHLVGTWDYEVLNTPSGDYFGKITFTKENQLLNGYITTQGGRTYFAKINSLKGDSINLFTNAEGFFSTIKGVIKEGIWEGEVSNQFSGTEPYPFYAKRKTIVNERKVRRFELKDAKTQEAISFAHINFQEGGTVTNGQGEFSVKKQNGEKIKIAAIGYETQYIEINWQEAQREKTIFLKPQTILLPEIEINARSLNAKDIVKAAINRINENYWQQPHNTELFYRLKISGPNGQLSHHSEALLDFYDSEGYKKRGWRKVTKARFTKLKQGRIVVGEYADFMEGLGLGRIAVFWAHEPIITRDKPFALSSLDGFDYQLIGVTKLGDEEVYKIRFDCKKLRDRYTGLGRLKTFNGTLYINKKDYALIRYQSYTENDWSYENKQSRKYNGGRVREVRRTNKIELFAKKEGKYISTFAKSETEAETHNLARKEVLKSTFMHEIQVLNANFQNLQMFKTDLWDYQEEITYDPSFWAKFNIVENEY